MATEETKQTYVEKAKEAIRKNPALQALVAPYMTMANPALGVASLGAYGLEQGMKASQATSDVAGQIGSAAIDALKSEPVQQALGVGGAALGFPQGTPSTPADNQPAPVDNVQQAPANALVAQAPPMTGGRASASVAGIPGVQNYAKIYEQERAKGRPELQGLQTNARQEEISQQQIGQEQVQRAQESDRAFASRASQLDAQLAGQQAFETQRQAKISQMETELIREQKALDAGLKYAPYAPQEVLDRVSTLAQMVSSQNVRPADRAAAKRELKQIQGEYSTPQGWDAVFKTTGQSVLAAVAIMLGGIGAGLSGRGGNQAADIIMGRIDRELDRQTSQYQERQQRKGKIKQEMAGLEERNLALRANLINNSIQQLGLLRDRAKSAEQVTAMEQTVMGLQQKLEETHAEQLQRKEANIDKEALTKAQLTSEMDRNRMTRASMTAEVQKLNQKDDKDVNLEGVLDVAEAAFNAIGGEVYAGANIVPFVDTDAKAYSQSVVPMVTSMLVRKLQAGRGVTDNDYKIFVKTLPTAYDTKEMATKKWGMIRNALSAAKGSQEGTYIPNMIAKSLQFQLGKQ